MGEFQAPETATTGRGEFFFQDTTYAHGDAELAYAMVRRFAPARVIEVGSGFSTLVLARAVAANRDDGRDTRLEVNDPYPQGPSSRARRTSQR